VLRVKTEGALPSARVLDAPGGFCWWYAEVHDPARERALVVIWSFGLPFLPGLAHAARSGRATAARARPSVCVALYEGGREAFYVLHELAADHADVHDDDGVLRARFGRSSLTIDRARGQLDAYLDVPCPGGAVTGSLSLVGTPVVVDADPLPACDHAWCPLVLPATGRASLSLSGAPFACEGAAYLDHNESTRPLHDLGIARWVWGRAPVDDDEVIFYALSPDDGTAPHAHAFTVDGTGRLATLRGAEVAIDDEGPSLFGLRGVRRAAVSLDGRARLTLDVTHLVDDGPFYQRALARSADGQHGSLEVIAPHRIDLSGWRPLVRMRVSSETRSNSVFLPLFAGPRAGRVARLFGRG